MHPLKKETNASQASKLSRMTSGYGLADKKTNQKAKIEQHPLGSSGPEEHVGFGADDSRPNAHAARRIRKPWPGNELATYKRGGRVKRRESGGPVAKPLHDQPLDPGEGADMAKAMRGLAGKRDDGPKESGWGQNELNQYGDNKRGGRVKHRGSGGGVSDDTDIETADIDQKLASQQGYKHGGRLKAALNKDRSHLPSTAMGPGGGKPTKRGDGTTIFPKPVKGSQKYATKSTEPSPTPVLNRAWGGRAESAGGKAAKGKHKGGTHVNIMIAPQHGAAGAAGAPPVSAMPTPPPMPPKPPAPPPGAAAGPPGAGMPNMPPGAMPPGALPPGGVPPGLMRKHGGRVMKHDDAKADLSLIRKSVKSEALKPHGSMRAAGGRIGMTHLTAGAYSGEGRLEKAHQNKRIAPQKV